MPHYGVLREYKLEDVDDVRGADVYGVNDENLGTIDDVIFDHSTGEIRYIVVKTGGLIGGKRIMVPASRIAPYGNHDDKFYAELDPERLEMMPEFDEQRLKSESEWSNYEKDYEKRWNDGAIMYDKETMRIITPAHEEVVPQQGRPLSQAAKESLNRDFTPQRLGKEDDYLGVASGHDKTTLHPARPSIAGREDAIRQSSGQDLRQSDAGPEIAGRQDLNRQNVGRESLHDETMNHGGVPGQTTREIEGVMSTEFEVSSSPESTPREAMREPAVYKLDPVPEAGQNAQTTGRDVTEAPNEALNAKYGRRWTAFQKHLRERRDKVVSGCDLCGTQEKVA